MGVIEALAHRTYRVNRLLELAQPWQVGLVGEVQRARSYRTARQLKPAELDELVMAYAAGATVFELGDRFGIDRRTVGKHLRGRGVDTTPPGLDPEDVSAAAELYREGWSLLRIAEKFGTTASTVRRRLLEIGLRMRKPWERV